MILIRCVVKNKYNTCHIITLRHVVKNKYVTSSCFVTPFSPPSHSL